MLISQHSNLLLELLLIITYFSVELLYIFGMRFGKLADNSLRLYFMCMLQLLDLFVCILDIFLFLGDGLGELGYFSCLLLDGGVQLWELFVLLF